MKQDNTNDTERLRYQDVNLRRAIQRRQQRAPQLPADFSLHSRKHVTRWHRMAAAFIATFFFHINVIWIILCAAAIGVGMALLGRRGGARG